ncbi:hypothetical protein HHS34_005590 [Acidithiobacillus montserratensis]|uniref:Uncharacterized protein n=1 Tax=Acidithiobacillus montserratensis TaxID=2729135 RepID=A0ACD5HJC8_9PROT|nr:hypothetical protein [Acidithiobacillus montserratensis]MBU2747849.1 hypothetical protein [Acidithiobacillus montserratensis]
MAAKKEKPLTEPVTVRLKFEGVYAAHLRSRCPNRRMSMASLAHEYVMQVIDAEQGGGTEMEKMERRIVATIRNAGETVLSHEDVNTAIMDMFMIQFFLHLPEPVGQWDAMLASALARREKFIEQVAKYGFDRANRPLALEIIQKSLEKRFDELPPELVYEEPEEANTNE